MRPWLLALAITGCDAYDRDLGPAPFLCGPTEPRCPMDYTCATDPATGADVCLGANGSSSSFTCADDTAHEPNDTFATASTTAVDQMKTYVLDGLAICPATDKDTFAATTATTGENLEVTVAFQRASPVLRVSIFNSGGVPIASALPVTNTPDTIRAYAPNLTAGVYYAQVSGPNTGSGAVNNYKLTLVVTGP